MKKIQSLTNMTVTEFNKAYSENRDSIFNYLSWKINDAEEAEFLVVDVFMKAERTYNKEKANICSFPSWLRTVANTAIVDYYRTDHSDKYMSVSDFVNHETGEETFQFTSNIENNADFNLNNDVLKERIAKAFSGLKPKYKRIAELYFIDDEDYIKIAEICNVPMGTVKGMINRVREKLQSELKDLHKVRTRKVQIAEEV